MGSIHNASHSFVCQQKHNTRVAKLNEGLFVKAATAIALHEDELMHKDYEKARFTKPYTINYRPTHAGQKSHKSDNPQPHLNEFISIY